MVDVHSQYFFIWEHHYCLDGHLAIDDCDFTLFQQCETH